MISMHTQELVEVLRELLAFALFLVFLLLMWASRDDAQ